MIGLDTNVVVSWLVEGRTPRLKRGETFRISYIVLFEFEWVMRRRFRYDRASLAALLERVLTLSDVIVDRVEAAKLAVSDYANGAELADAMIARDNAAAGCDVTLTLDRGAAAAGSGFVYWHG